MGFPRVSASLLNLLSSGSGGGGGVPAVPLLAQTVLHSFPTFVVVCIGVVCSECVVVLCVLLGWCVVV